MSVRNTAPEPSATELARRRLGMLGAELSSARPEPGPGAVASATPSPPEVPTVVRPGRHARPRLTRTSRVAGRLADALPPTLHGRLFVTAHHVTVVALVLAAALTLAAWLVVRSDPAALPERASLRLPVGAPAAQPLSEPPEPPATGAVTALPTVTASAVPVPAAATVGGDLVVHVTGRVRRPGVVELPAGSRVIDAIEAAGGARAGARLGALNLARPLVDGEQVAVGVPAAVSVPPQAAPVGTPLPPGPTGASGELVNLNTATQTELEELPGVGPVTATSIIEWRTEHGGFSTVDELIEVSGIGEVTLAELRDLVTV
jgi:competence protein ComEA